MKASLDEAGVTNQDQALRQAAGESFYNTSKFTLRDLRHRASQQNLRDDFIAYLDGFSPNVQEIISNFDFRHQVPKLSRADALGTLIEKLLDSAINLSPKPVLDGNTTVKHPGLDNHAMGTVFEELVRRFNEDTDDCNDIALPLPLPDEQEVICSWIQRETGDLSETQAVAREEIDLLREYRTRLIADVVTGRLDVREAASKLPDTLADEEAIDASIGDEVDDFDEDEGMES